MSDRHIPITEGTCWCGIDHHCCHVNQHVDDIERELEEVCCLCGMVLPIIRGKSEKHGPWAPWVYVPIHVEPEKDVCSGLAHPVGLLPWHVKQVYLVQKVI